MKGVYLEISKHKNLASEPLRLFPQVLDILGDFQRCNLLNLQETAAPNKHVRHRLTRRFYHPEIQ